MSATPQWLVDTFDRGRIRRQLPSSAQIDIESTYGRSNAVIFVVGSAVQFIGRPLTGHAGQEVGDLDPRILSRIHVWQPSADRRSGVRSWS
jgi:hypothetical protein